jgi:hypothetical protein
MENLQLVVLNVTYLNLIHAFEMLHEEHCLN